MLYILIPVFALVAFLQTTDTARYSVWVGGVEVNDYYLTKEQAEELAELYKADGYDDIEIVEAD